MASWRCLAGPRFRPIGLSLLRVSTAVAASIAIAGCAVHEPKTICVRGVLYVGEYRGGVTPAIDLKGNPIPCEADE